ncbi:hypothetical protein BV898_10059 [Hypsibius exemplaris]|uniref:CUB domain-containing protein n=1 Tax=Hypsibius exemplaris TaxID=2072580 RepID=A0A1W0WKW9_HYPEX|nr:hypothetical protein BV898_10059 [Hypsibius exemplaris]
MKRSRSPLAVVILLFFCTIRLDAQSYSADNLSERCGSTITVPCEPTEHGRAGYLFLTEPLTANCSVTLAVNTSSPNCLSGETYSLYLNFDTLKIHGDAVIVTKLDELTRNSIKLKYLHGIPQSAHNNLNVPSMAQYLSEWSALPKLTITLAVKQPARSSSKSQYYLGMGYNLIHRSSSSRDSYCNALGGYIQIYHICDTTRVNCPTSYHASVEGLNPATAIEKASFATCGYSGSTVAGIAGGVILAMFTVIAVATIAHRQCCTRRETNNCRG